MAEKYSLPEEFRLELTVSNQNPSSILCSNANLKELVVGYLYNTGSIQTMTDISAISIQETKAIVALRSTRNIPYPLVIQTQPLQRLYTIAKIRQCAGVMNDQAINYKRTGGMHSAALFEGYEQICHFEDIGRHNALDKLTGDLLLRNMVLQDALLITSGRISADMVQKSFRLGVSVIVSYSTATQSAYELATQANITLVCYLNRETPLVLSAPERITT